MILATVSFNLAALYDEATHLTSKAGELLAHGDDSLARDTLRQRAALVRRIQRETVKLTPWGSCPASDAAALRYLAADRRLESLIDHC